MIGSTRRREGDGAAMALEELHAQLDLQRLHHAADRPLGDAQLVGGRRKAQEPTGDREAAHGIERG